MIKAPTLLLTFFTISLLLMTSCEEVIDLPTVDFEDKLVISGIFNDGARWTVEVLSNNNRLDDDTKIEQIENATVEIYNHRKEFIYELFHEGDGIYGNEDYGPSSKSTYSVKVSAPGFKAVTATSFVPEKSTLIINHFSIIPNEKFEDVEVDFVIEDNSKLDAYYIWEIVSLKGDIEEGTEGLSKNWLDELTDTSDDIIKDEREILGNNSFGDGTYSGTYSSLDGNRSINVLSGTGDSEFVSYVTENNPLGKLDPDTGIPDVISQNTVFDETTNHGGETEERELKYELRVMSISKDLYKYHSSVKALRINGVVVSDMYFPDAYSNVSQGGGIFAGFSESSEQF